MVALMVDRTPKHPKITSQAQVKREPGMKENRSQNIDDTKVTGPKAETSDPI